MVVSVFGNDKATDSLKLNLETFESDKWYL